MKSFRINYRIFCILLTFENDEAAPIVSLLLTLNLCFDHLILELLKLIGQALFLTLNLTHSNEA